MNVISRRIRIVVGTVVALTAISATSHAAEWASGPALGNVLASRGTSVLVYSHDGVELESIDVGAQITATAFSPGLDLFAVTSDGNVWQISRTSTPRVGSVPVATISTASTVAAPRSIVFDEFGNFYVGLASTRTTPAEVRKYTLNNGIYQLVLTHFIQCDASVGLWLDLAPADPMDGQLAWYTCGGREIRTLDVASAPQSGSLTSTTLFKSLQNPGSARDLRLLPPKASVGVLPSASHVQGGVIVADRETIRLLDALGNQDFSFGLTRNMDSWSRIELAPIAGTFWAAQDSTPGLYRFRLAPTLTAQPELQISAAGTVAALAVNGGYRTAISTQLLMLQPPVTPTTSSSATVRWLRNTIWESAFEISAAPVAPVRIAVTLHEGRSGETGVPADFDLDLRFRNLLPKPVAVQAYHGRAAFVRDVQTTAEDANLPSLVSISYRLVPTLSSTSATVLVYQPDPVCHLGISCGNPAIVGQFTKQIQREWFKTDELTRTKKSLGCDLLVGIASPLVSNVIVNPTEPPVKTFQIGNQIPVRAKIGNGKTDRCADAVLTISRAAANGLGTVIVGSSETTLTDSRGIRSVFVHTSGGCQANVLLRDGTIAPFASELYPDEIDFQPGRTYNVCVGFKTLQAFDEVRTTVGPAFGDACVQIKTAK